MSGIPDSPSLEQVLAHEGFIRSVAKSLLRGGAAGGDVDEVVQQTLWTAIRRPPSSEGLRGFLRRVVRSRVVDRRRQEAVRGRTERRAARAESVPSAAEIVAQVELREQVARAVLALDDPYRATVWLRFFEELPPREVARRMGVPVATVHTRLRRALEELRLKLRGSDEQDVFMASIAVLAGEAPPISPAGALPWKLPAAFGAVALAVAAVLLFLLPARGAAAPGPWDFVVGRWEVRARALVGPGRWLDQPPAESVAARLADGTIREEWRYAGERHALVRSQDAASGSWRLRWTADDVPRLGVEWFEGAFDGTSGDFAARYPDERPPAHRLTFRVADADQFTMEFATSGNRGRTWITRYVREYRRLR